MDILEEIQELKDKLALLENKAKQQGETTISDIKVGEKFIYCEHNYTKLNEDNLCIIDDFDAYFMYCIFDPITNNYDESIIRQYLNSERFINELKVNKDNIIPHYQDDLLTLLTIEEFNKYKTLIANYDVWWATRSAYSINSGNFCYISSSGYINGSNVNGTSGVRLGFRLKPETPVDRKGNK